MSVRLSSLRPRLDHAESSCGYGEPDGSPYSRPALYIAGLAWLTAVIALYGRVVVKLASDWQADESYSHGLLVAPVALFLIWRERDRIRHAPLRPSAAGLIVVAGALGLFVAGSLGAELFTTRASLVLLVAGTILYAFGWAHLRLLAFPVAFLLFAIPLPATIFDQLTQSLQLVSSRLGEQLLRTVDVPVLRDGNVLTLSTVTLQVTDACSGIRSLMSLLAMSSLAAYLFEPTRVRRATLMFSAVPLAIALNGLRLAVTGAAAFRYGPDAARGLIHETSGWAIFVAALTCIWMLHGAMQWLSRRVPPPKLVEAV
jgi:exosortase